MKNIKKNSNIIEIDVLKTRPVIESKKLLVHGLKAEPMVELTLNWDRNDLWLMVGSVVSVWFLKFLKILYILKFFSSCIIEINK